MVLLFSEFIAAWICVEILAWALMRRPHRLRACKLVFSGLDRGHDPYLAPAKGHPIINFVPCSMPAEGINRTGHRSVGPTEGFQGVRIYLGGDCTFFDAHLPANASMGYLLQEELSRRGHCIEVVNAAFQYYSSIHSVTRLMLDTLRFNSNIAILKTGINDVEAFFCTGGALEPDYSNYYRVVPSQPAFSGLIKRLPKLLRTLPSVRLYVYFKIWRQIPVNWFHWNVIRHANPTFMKRHLAKCYELFHTGNLKKNLITFISVCRAHGITPVLATNYFQRSDMLSPGRAFLRYGIEKVNEEIRRTSEEQQVLLADLDHELSRAHVEIDNKWHFRRSANLKRVQVIADALETHESTRPYFSGNRSTRGNNSSIGLLTTY